MKLQRNAKYLIEPPSVATGDIAFNLIVFFLVCASTQPDSGRKQDVPRAETKQESKQQSDNVQVAINRQGVFINGRPVLDAEFTGRLRAMLATKKREEDRVVVVKSTKDTPYEKWIRVTGWIEEAGGVVTLQLEEERTVITQ